MTRYAVFALFAMTPAFAQPSSGPAAVVDSSGDEKRPVVLETKDRGGRVQTRTTFHPDRSRHATIFEYRPDGDVVKRTVDEDLDPAGRPLRRLVQEFDEQGRILERIETALDKTGAQTGKKTRYEYDAAGGRKETSAPATRR